MITDEIVKKALEAFLQTPPVGGYDAMRAALEAVAPMLIEPYQQSLNKLGEAYDKKCEEVLKARAEGMRDASDILAEEGWLGDSKKRIDARAQELDPK